jgi:hypothetical protein
LNSVFAWKSVLFIPKAFKTLLFYWYSKKTEYLAVWLMVA